METTDLTLQVLREIRDEIKITRTELSERIDQTNLRLDQTNLRLDRHESRIEAVERRITDSELRLATELVAVAHAVDKVRVLLDERLDLFEKFDDHEKRLRALETPRHA